MLTQGPGVLGEKAVLMAGQFQAWLMESAMKLGYHLTSPVAKTGWTFPKDVSRLYFLVFFADKYGQRWALRKLSHIYPHSLPWISGQTWKIRGHDSEGLENGGATRSPGH